MDVDIHHRGEFIRDPILRYTGGVEEVLKIVVIDSFTKVGE